MSIKMLLLHFVIGGAVVSVISYFGSQAKSQLAAFFAFFPSISVITLSAIYLASGTQVAVSYAKSMLFLLPSWVLYAVCIVFLLPRLGLAGSLALGVALYIGTAFLVMKFV